MNEEQWTVRGILDYAIKKERESYELYTRVSAMAEVPGTRSLLTELAEAEAEAGHEELLRGLDLSGLLKASPPEMEDLYIAEFFPNVELAPDADLLAILVYAMKREEKSRDFYTAMARWCGEKAEPKLFDRLAAEESAHNSPLKKRDSSLRSE